jgi:predicted nuclease of restriction endonuclease-like RecB superfamily
VIDLDGRDTLVPDYTLIHEDGREALLELVFAWRRRQFEKRVELLAAAGPANLIIALTTRGDLGGGDKRADALELPTLTTYRFKGVISPRKIIELAERVALTPDQRGAT